MWLQIISRRRSKFSQPAPRDFACWQNIAAVLTAKISKNICLLFYAVSVDGIEPSASVLSGQRSTTELHAQNIYVLLFITKKNDSRKYTSPLSPPHFFKMGRGGCEAAGVGQTEKTALSSSLF